MSAARSQLDRLADALIAPPAREPMAALRSHLARRSALTSDGSFAPETATG